MTLAPDAFPFRLSAFAQGLLILAGWSIYALLFSLQSYYYWTSTGAETSFGRIFMADATSSGLWALLTPLVLWIARRYRVEKSRWFSRILILLFAAVIVAAFHRAMAETVGQILRNLEAPVVDWTKVYRSVLGFTDYGVLIFLVVVLIDHVIGYAREVREEVVRIAGLKSQLAQAHLMALRMQIQPHFLFNAMNSIAVLIDEDPPKAKEMVERFSDFLRLTLERAETQEVTLREELEFLSKYLSVEEIRFGDRLTIVRNIADAVLEASVPYLIMQPLIENAVKHGIGRTPGPGTITIEARRENGFLNISVADTGIGIRGGLSGETGFGVGLTNTEHRLKTLYGDKGRIELTRLPSGVRTSITIPFGMAIEGKADS